MGIIEGALALLAAIGGLFGWYFKSKADKAEKEAARERQKAAIKEGEVYELKRKQKATKKAEEAGEREERSVKNRGSHFTDSSY